MLELLSGHVSSFLSCSLSAGCDVKKPDTVHQCMLLPAGVQGDAQYLVVTTFPGIAVELQDIRMRHYVGYPGRRAREKARPVFDHRPLPHCRKARRCHGMQFVLGLLGNAFYETDFLHDAAEQHVAVTSGHDVTLALQLRPSARNDQHPFHSGTITPQKQH